MQYTQDALKAVRSEDLRLLTMNITVNDFSDTPSVSQLTVTLRRKPMMGCPSYLLRTPADQVDSIRKLIASITVLAAAAAAAAQLPRLA